MGVVLPNDVAIFLNLLGIPWINVDEDHVREIATHTRTFIGSVDHTFGAAKEQITAMGSDFSGRSYEVLLARWAHLDRTHMSVANVAGVAVAQALDVAADIIAMTKIAVVVELTSLLAASGLLLATGGGNVLQPLVAAAARRVVSALKSTIEQHVFGEVIEKALLRFEDTVERVVDGIESMVYDAASAAVGPDVSTGAFRLHPEPVLRRAATLEALADELAEHHRRFTEHLARIDIGPSEFAADVVGEIHPAATDRQELLPTATAGGAVASGKPGEADKGSTDSAGSESDKRPVAGRAELSVPADAEISADRRSANDGGRIGPDYPMSNAIDDGADSPSHDKRSDAKPMASDETDPEQTPMAREARAERPAELDVSSREAVTAANPNVAGAEAAERSATAETRPQSDHEPATGGGAPGHLPRPGSTLQNPRRRLKVASHSKPAPSGARQADEPVPTPWSTADPSVEIPASVFAPADSRQTEAAAAERLSAAQAEVDAVAAPPSTRVSPP